MLLVRLQGQVLFRLVGAQLEGLRITFPVMAAYVHVALLGRHRVAKDRILATRKYQAAHNSSHWL